MRVSTSVLLVSFTALVACTDVDAPDDLLLVCANDDECPAGYSCDEGLGVCQKGTIVVDRLALVDSSADVALVGRPFLEAGTPVAFRFTLNGITKEPPRARLFDGAVDVAVVACDKDGDDTHHVCRYTVTGEEPETTVRVALEAIDARGVAATFDGAATVRFDFTGPLPVAVSLQRVPDPQRTPVAADILDTTVIGPNVDVRLVFSTDEPVFIDGDDAAVDEDPDHVVGDGDDRAPAVVTAGAQPLVFSRDRRSGNPLIFNLVWPASADDGDHDGDHDVVVRLTDLAGNTSEGPVAVVDGDGDGIADGGLVVDGTAPSVPDVQTDGRIVFERAPWGTLTAPRNDVFDVVGAVGSVDPRARVIVTRYAALRFELARVVADDDGAFVAEELPIGDIASVFVRAADDAGNVSDAVGVRNVRWIVTPFGKVEGSTLENPHTFQELPLFAPQLQHGGVIERGGDIGVGVAADGEALTTIGAGTWRKVVETPISFAEGGFDSGFFDATVVADPLRGTLLLFGRGRLSDGNGPSGFAGRSVCANQVIDVKVRDENGHFHRGPAPPSSVSAASVLAFVPPKGRIFVLSSNAATFSFDGERWRPECSSDCADGVVGTPVGAMAWDAHRAVLVAVGSGGQIVELDPTGPIRWHVTTTNAPGDRRPVYDARAKQVVFYDGGLVGWDGTTLTNLCTGACAETAPPSQPGAKIAFDDEHDEIVMFGGLGTVPCRLQTAHDVFASQGLAPSATPAPRDTWTFDGTVWTRHAPATTPAGRSRHTMTWDPGRRRVLLVGGDDCECMRDERAGLGTANMIGGLPNDAWEWDGATWAQVAQVRQPAGFDAPAVPPGARDHVVIESPDGALLSTGGSVLRLFRDDSWHARGGSTPTTGSVNATWATSSEGEILGIGGATPLDGELISPGEPFLARIVDGAATIACNGDPALCLAEPLEGVWGSASWHDGTRFYVFGGAQPISPQSGATPAGLSNDRLLSWSASEGWRIDCQDSPCSDARPGPRVLHRAALDGDGHGVVFGGLVSNTDTTDESWQWDGSSWTATPGQRPPARAGHVMAYDVDRDAVIVAYGTDRGGQGFELGFEGPEPLRAHEIPEALSEVWEFADGIWAPVPHVDLEGDGRPAPRSSVSGAGLPQGGVVLFGGTLSPATTYAEVADFFGPPTPRDDETWVWDGAGERGPAHRLTLRTDRVISRLEADDEIQGLTVRWRSSAARSDSGVAGDVGLVWWDGHGWKAIDDDHRIDCGAGCVGGVLDADDARQALTSGLANTIAVAATTATPNGLAPGRAQLVTDGVEVVLSWRRPAAIEADLP